MMTLSSLSGGISETLIPLLKIALVSLHGNVHSFHGAWTMKQTMETLAQVAGSAEDLIFVVDPALLIQYVNRRGSNLTGCDPEEVIGKPFSQLFPQNGHEALKKHLQAVFDSGSTLSSENRIALPHEELWMDTRLAPIRDEAGRIVAVLGIARDVTESRVREETIARSRREWVRAVDSMPFLLAVVNQEYRIERVNTAMAERMGVSVRDAVGLSCCELLHGGRDAPSFCPLRQTASDGEERAVRIYDNLGGAGVAVRVTPLKDPQGNLVGCVYVGRDMTESEKAMTEKSKRAEYMKQLVKSADYVVLIQDEAGKYIYFSAMPSEGTWPWDIVGKTPYDFFEPETAAEMMEKVKRAARSSKSLSDAGRLSCEGETFHYHEKMSSVKDAGGHTKAVVTIWRRIHGVKENLEECQSAAERKRSLTPREREILRHIGEGHTNQQIAEKLGVTKKTVETHRSMIMRKLDLHSTSALVRYALKSELL